ncbi:hypothetical protein, variant [Aphanomyces invadans]|uniref:Uncharacterized protein n=1 Tax=Aphanomyces invadans TaxID=157072 RepID=A0A024TRH0_9STRA|nr:hypothetical protein, variant [Aphanomyces invadans]ETV96604.1 hypothetical protein, variant [Aphanomyces invadans]|eukprot:XP_008874867.1 hypothetical protein, variant [Aphanomyces invadans]
MAYFSNKQACVWHGGYKLAHPEPASDATMGYSGAAAAVLHDKALVVGGRDLLGERLHEKSLVILFDMNQERIVYDYDVVGAMSRRIGHAVAALPSTESWFVFGGELLADEDNSRLLQPLGDLHRVTYANHVARIEKLKDGPVARAWHTLTTIRYRPPQDAPPTLKGKQASISTIQVSELDDALLLLGGKNGGKDVWVFQYEKVAPVDDGDSNAADTNNAPKWSKMQTDGASPLPLAYHTCHAVGDGTKVAVVGGVRDGVFSDALSILDVLTGTWTTLVQSPLLQRSCHSTAFVHAPTSVVSGPSSEAFASLFPRLPAPPPEAPSKPSDMVPACTDSFAGLDCLVVFGGITPEEVAPLDCFVAIDPVAGAVVRVDGHLALSSHMGQAVAASTDRRKLFVFGGTHATSHAWLDTTMCVDLWTYQHDPLPPPPLERMRTVEYSNGDVYLGELNDANLRHGLGTCTYATGDAYEGHWADDLWAGQGRWEATDGQVYVGSFCANQRHGSGLWTCSPRLASASTPGKLIEVSYDGPWARGRRHGSDGVVMYSNGATLKGAWVDDVLQASTVVIESYVDRGGKLVGLYEGAVDDTALHAPHGQGRFESRGYPKCGEMYSGSWAHGKREGQGMCMAFDGTVYMGEWKNGKRNGMGACDYAKTRDRYEGKWVGDVRCGLGTCTYAAGFVYEGQWTHDKRHGDGRCTYKDGTFYQGHWENDEFCGDGALILPSA